MNSRRIDEFVHSRRFPVFSSLVLCTGLIFLVAGIVLTIIGSTRTTRRTSASNGGSGERTKQEVELYSMKTELYKNYTWKQYLDNMDNPKTIDFTNEVQLRLRQLIRESRSHNRRTLFEFQEVSNNAYDVLKVQILKYEQTAADGILVYASAILLGDHIPPEKDISATINSVTNNTVTASNATTVQTFSAEYCKEMERPIATTPPVATSTLLSTTSSPQQSTTSSLQATTTREFTTSSSPLSSTTTVTTPAPTQPYCKGGNGPFVKQDISVVFELSTARAIVDKKIAHFIGNTLFPPEYYELPGSSGNDLFTQLLIAPFPNTSTYKGIVRPDYAAIKGLADVQAWLNAVETLDGYYNFNGDAIVDGVEFFATQNFANKRQGVKKSLLIIASSDIGVSGTQAAVAALKKTSTVITISVGSGAQTLGSLASAGFAFSISNLEDAIETSTVVSNISSKLLIQSGVCPTQATTVYATLPLTSPQPHTTLATTSHLTTSVPKPASCNDGNGPFVKQDISVVFELSAARAPVDKKIADFIGYTLFPTEHYELPGSSGNDPVTQLLVAPFPNTTTYQGIVKTDYTAIKDLADVQAWLNAAQTLEGHYKLKGDAIVDGIDYFTNQNFENKRQGVKRSVFIIASSDAGVAGAKTAVEALKKTSTIVTISVGSGAQTLESLASAGFAFTISSLDNLAETSRVVSNITSKLLVESSFCPLPSTTTVLPSTLTQKQSTSAAPISTTTSEAPTTNTHCAMGIVQDIAIVFDQSSSNAILADKVAKFIENTLFASSNYLITDSNGNTVTQLLPIPYPLYNGGFISPKYPIWKSKNDFFLYIWSMRNVYRQLSNYIAGTGIADSLNLVKTANTDSSHRNTVNSTLIVVGSGASDINKAQSIADDIKNAGMRIITIGTSGDSTFHKLSSGSSGDEFTIKDISDNAFWAEIAENITLSLAELSGQCMPLTQVTPPPATAQSTTSLLTTASTTTVQETTVCTGPSSIDEDIAVVYDLSSGDVPASPDQVVDFIRSGLFNKSKYGNAQYAAVPFPSISSETDLLTMGYANFALLRSLTHDTLPVWKRHSNLKSTISDGLKNVWRINNGTLGENHRRKGVPNTIMIIAKSDTDVPNSEPIAKVLQAQGSTLLTVSIGAKTNLTPLASNQYSFTVSDFSNSSELASIAEKITEALAPCYAKRR
ncbi:hypothetical protein QR680_000095 [Steinernema hermaphroditum]|uniref:VWFA domain-containing protein n=1 Tax=Steinernema hermaphroditum TaxID=289476 RepID=A0AA39GTJ2_9BILA|nr:hypothetical protein QR680_000095 [Steinernema hermaphroditum]